MESTNSESTLPFYRQPYFWGIIGVLLLTFIVYSSYINNGLVWIDHQDIERGWGIVTLDHWTDAFTAPLSRSGFYRPLVVLSYSLDALLYKNWIPGYHLTNVLWQLAMVLVSIIITKRVFLFDNKKNLLIGLIAGIHPVTFLPVGVITYRQEIMVTLFSFLALLFYVEGRKKQQWRYGILALFCFILALWSKETAFAWIPALIIVWELFLRKETFSKLNINNETTSKFSFYYKLIVSLGGIVIMVLYIIIRKKIIPQLWNFPSVSMTISEHIGTRIKVIGIRLVELISPFKPSLSDATRIVTMLNVIVILIILFFIVLIFIVFKYHKKNPKIITLLLFLGIGLAPALNLLPPPRFNAPHYSYFSILIVAMLMVIGFEFLQKRTKQKLVWPSILTIYLLIMVISTFTAGFHFENDLTLFEPEIKRDPRYREAHFYVGTHYFREQNFEKAEQHLKLAITETLEIISFVDLPAAKMNLAGIYLAQGKLNEAEQLILEIDPAQTELPIQIPYNLALIAKERKEYGKVTALLEAIPIEQHTPESVLLLAQAYLLIGEEKKADFVLTSYFPGTTAIQLLDIKVQLRQ